MDFVRETLRAGVRTAREEAEKTLEEVREAMNMKI